MKPLAILTAFLFSMPLIAQAQNEGYPGQKQGENATEYHILTGEEARMARESMNMPGRRPMPPAPRGSNWAQPSLFASRAEKQQFKADRKVFLADKQRRKAERASRRH